MIKEYPLLISAVREQLIGEVPRMIVLDTLNKSLVGSESKDVDMAAYIVAAEALRDAFDCVVMIIHHCGYDETHPRGHTSLTGAVDAEFEVVREGMLVTVKNVTMRDGPEGFEIRSQAEVVEVGEDITGKTSRPWSSPRRTRRPQSGRRERAARTSPRLSWSTPCGRHWPNAAAYSARLGERRPSTSSARRGPDAVRQRLPGGRGHRRESGRRYVGGLPARAPHGRSRGRHK